MEGTKKVVNGSKGTGYAAHRNDILYPKINDQYAPDIADDNLAVSEVYRISKEEFERMMTTYFSVSVEQLREYCRYERSHLSWVEFGRIIILILLFGIQLWFSHLKMEFLSIFLIL